MKIKRLTSLLLAGAMCVSVVGCGKSSGNKKKEELSYYKLSQEEELDYIISDTIINDNVIYGTYYKSEENGEWGDEDYSYKEIQGIVKYDINAKERSETELDIDEGYINSLYLNQNGELVVEAQRYINGGFDKTEIVTDEEENGEEEGDNEENEDEEFQYTDITYVYNTDLELLSKDESEPKTESYDGDEADNREMVYSTSIDNEGNYIKLVTKDGDKFYIKTEDKEGNEKSKIDLEDLYANSLIKMSDGSYLVIGWGESGEEIYKVDFKEEKLGDKFVDTTALFNVQGAYGGNDNTLLINVDGYLNVCDGTTGKMTKVLKYMDCDVDYNYVRLVFQVDENTYGIVIADYENDKSEIDFLTRLSSDETVKKQEIHIATLSMDDEIKQLVIQFNKKSEDYKIVVDEYFNSEVFSTETGYEDAIRRFNADITSDGAADIIDLSSINIKQYSDKGIFEDITPYLEKDSDLSKDDFIESVVKAYESDGKLYAIPAYINIQAIAGRKSQIGDDVSWTIQDFIDYVESLPEGVEVFNNVTSDELLYSMIISNINEYIDWKTGNCSFNSDEFVNFLELCSKYKTSEEFYAEYDDEDWENEPSEITKIKNNKVALQRLWIYSVEEYQVAEATFEDDLSIKGYPTSEGNGIVVSSPGSMLAINSKSKYKDEAWNFIKQLYKYDSEDSYFGFPTKKSELDNMFEKMKERHMETAPDGTQYYTTWGFGDGTEFYIANPTDEEINAVKDMINNADRVVNYSEQEIYNILQEETESFFKGEKTAKEVADVIQSRVSIYVKESK